MTARFAKLLRDAKEMVQEQVEYRDLLYQMTKRDLLLRYKQTVMGFGWAIFTPLINTAIFSVIFTRVAPIDTEVPYPLFAYCGLWAWNFTASSLKFAVNSLTGNSSLVTKVYFPREIFPLSAVVVCIVDFAVASVVLVAMMIYWRIPVGAPLLMFPVVLVIQLAFTMAVALMLAMWNLFYRDIKYLFEVVIVVWMFGTSVLYPTGMVGGRLSTLLQLNPMTPIIDGYRSVLLYSQWPAIGPLAATGVGAFLLLGLAWISFHRAEFEFAESV